MQKCGRGRDKHIYKRRLLRFGFDSLKSGKFQRMYIKNKATERPMGDLYATLIGFNYFSIESKWVNISHSVGLTLLASIYRQFPEPQTVKQATVLASTLFY